MKVSLTRVCRYKLTLSAVAISFLVAGCSVRNREDISDNSGNLATEDNIASVAGTDAVDTDNSGSENNAIADAEVVLSQAKDGIDVQLTNAGSSMEKIVVLAGDKAPQYKVSNLSNPQRVVVDIPGTKVKGTRVVALNNSQLFSRARVAARDNGTRVVFDVLDQKSEPVTANADVVMIGNQEDTKREIAANVNSESAEEKNIELAERQVETPLDDSQVDNIVAADAAAKVVLEELTIDNSDSENSSVVAKFTVPTDFSLKKTAPSEYVLKVRQAELSESASSPVVTASPRSFIRSARSTTDGEDLLIRIFAKPHVELTARGEGRDIVVAAHTNQLQQEDEFRAQLAPEKTAPAAETPAAAKPDTVDSKADIKVSDSAAKYGEVSKIYTGRLISLDLQDTDIDNALRIIAEVSNLNIIASEDVTGKVTLRLIDVPWDQALDVILKTNNLDKVQEGNVIRIAPIERLKLERESLKQARQAEEELEPLEVKYLRISYSKASELKALVESVMTERGTVAYDERTNQIIIKDISKGIKNAVELVERLDLRTPQVLLETQIVEANRNIMRHLGSRLGYRYLQSPEIGNATGRNFPNSVDFGADINNAGTANPISLLLGSADGSKSISALLTQIEQEGRARIVSRPSVATINNKPASIKSVQKIRIRLPSGGVSVATGQGANATGQSQTATETIEIGIVLEVTPQASPDYFVLLDINAKSSTLGSATTDGIPSEVERSALSSVLVSSGQTFALGGIYKISENDSIEGLPFFKDIPFFGHLFRRVNTVGSDEELLFFITPRIVEGSFDDAAMKS